MLLKRIVFNMIEIDSENSENFRKKVLTIKNKSGELSKWKDASNLEIYEHLMSGSEVLEPDQDCAGVAAALSLWRPC